GEGLLMSGLAMQAHRSSRPASGAGHQFSHLWEMEGLGQDWDPPLSHGMKVGLGTIAMCALYEVVLRRGLDGVDVDAAVAAWPRWDEMVERIRSARLPEEVTAAALEQSRAKYVGPEQLRERLEHARQRWPQIAARVREQLLPATDVEHTLQVVGAVSHPSQIGVDEAAFRAMYSRAQMIRKRYTLLDLLLEAGMLADCVDELFAPGGFWAQRPQPSDCNDAFDTCSAGSCSRGTNPRSGYRTGWAKVSAGSGQQCLATGVEAHDEEDDGEDGRQGG